MPNDVSPAEPSRLIAVDGINVNMRRKGSGTPVLFLHGSGGVARWLPFFDALAADYDVVVPDHPGFGLSDDPEWLTTMSDMALFYLDFMEALDLRGVHLAGNSLGGWIAAEMAVRDRSRLCSLSLIAPAGIKVKGVPFSESFLWSPAETARNLFHDQALAPPPPPMTDEALDVMLKNRSTAAKLGWTPRMMNPDLGKWLHRLRLPVHILWGDDDKLIPRVTADLWAASVPGSRLTTYAACGHLPHLEKAAEATRDMVAFFKECGP